MSKVVVCLYCGRALTWAERQFQYVRLIRVGVPKNEATAVLPLCHECTSGVLKRKGLQDS